MVKDLLSASLLRHELIPAVRSMSLWFTAVAVVTITYVIWWTAGSRKKLARDDSHRKQEKTMPVATVSTQEEAIVSCILAPGPAPSGLIDGVVWLDRKSGDVGVFGGLKESGKACGDLYLLSSENIQWTRHKAEKTLRPRFGHTVFLFADRVFFYGGGSGLDCLQENELLAVPAHSKTQQQPEARSYATISVWEKEAAMILFGGRKSANATLLDDAWRLELFSQPTGGDTSAETLIAKWQLLNPKATGYRPSARERHATVILNNQMYLFGGTGADGKSDLAPPNALEVLDLTSGAWSLLDTDGKPPRHLSEVLAHPIGSNAICLVEASGEGIFNSLALLRLEPGLRPTWSKLKLDWQSDWTMVPGPRKHHFACCDETGNSLFLFGGRSPSGFFSDTIILVDFSDISTAPSSLAQ